MNIRRGIPADAKALSELIASFHPMLTLDPSGAGAEQYFASVSEQAERQHLESPRYSYLVAEREGEVVGFIAMRDTTHHAVSTHCESKLKQRRLPSSMDLPSQFAAR